MSNKITISFFFQSVKTTKDVVEDAAVDTFIRSFLSEKKIHNYEDYELFSLKSQRTLTGTFSQNKIISGCEFVLQLRKNNSTKEIVSGNEIDDIEIEIIDEDEEQRGQILSNESINYSKYKNCQLDEIFNDTIVINCYLNIGTFNKIIEFYVKSISKKEKKEHGGFLLGKYYKMKEDAYEIFVEEIVIPDEYAFHDEYQIDFGTQAMIKLDSVLQKNKNLHLIGWFHTHPGHTPFLSKFDLNVHFGSFNEPYQIAIVTDTLTDNFDTVVFTRKLNMQMNNKEDMKKYLSWKK